MSGAGRSADWTGLDRQFVGAAKTAGLLNFLNQTVWRFVAVGARGHRSVSTRTQPVVERRTESGTILAEHGAATHCVVPASLAWWSSAPMMRNLASRGLGAAVDERSVP